MFVKMMMIDDDGNDNFIYKYIDMGKVNVKGMLICCF